MDSSKETLLAAPAPLLPEIPAEQLERLVCVPSDRAKGDFALPCFVLAKARKANPAAIARELASAVALPEGFSKAEAAGGYLNFFVDATAATSALLKKIEAEGDDKGKKVIEFLLANAKK